ncbi:hypothetical protein DPSP01_013560 [Paraphaeosphaeria sporulosa]
MTETYYTPDRDFLIREFRDNPEYTLHTAVVHGNLPQIRELLTADYDIDKLHDYEGTSKGRGTPLHVAIWSNQPAAFEYPPLTRRSCCVRWASTRPSRSTSLGRKLDRGPTDSSVDDGVQSRPCPRDNDSTWRMRVQHDRLGECNKCRDGR